MEVSNLTDREVKVNWFNLIITNRNKSASTFSNQLCVTSVETRSKHDLR